MNAPLRAKPHALQLRCRVDAKEHVGRDRAEKTPQMRSERPLEPYADIGSIRFASLFLTLPTRWLTGHATIAPVYGTSMDFS